MVVVVAVLVSGCGGGESEGQDQSSAQVLSNLCASVEAVRSDTTAGAGGFEGLTDRTLEHFETARESIASMDDESEYAAARDSLDLLVAYWSDEQDSLDADDVEEAGEVLEVYCPDPRSSWTEPEEARDRAFIEAARSSAPEVASSVGDEGFLSFGRAACSLSYNRDAEGLDQLESASGIAEVTDEYRNVTRQALAILCPEVQPS